MKAIIRNHRLVNGDGVETNAFTPGEPAQVVFEVETNEPLEDPVFGFAVRTHDFRMVCSADSSSLGHEVAPLAGKSVYRVTFDLKMYLGIGRYAVDLGCGELIDGTYDTVCRMHSALQFDVIEGAETQGSGTVSVFPRISVSEVKT
jgi:hypothetical protein